MDKFVIRTPTWKTLTYTATVEQFKTQQSAKKRPLQENVEQPISSASSNGSKPKTLLLKRRLSIRDEKLLELFSSAPDEPLVACSPQGNNQFSGGSQDSFFGNDSTAQGQPPADENQPLSSTPGGTTDKHLRDLGDYVNGVSSTIQPVTAHKNSVTFDDLLYKSLHDASPNAKNTTETPKKLSNEQHLAEIVRRMKSYGQDPTTTTTTSPDDTTKSKKTNSNTSAADSSKTPKTAIPHIARIKRDLNSPSATIRMRAIKALRSPTHIPYSTFDIPHEEQNIITEEERSHPSEPPSIESLMKDIVVYVEVRSGEDNRSWGVKKVIAMLGARVNDKLLRDTTHVIFKDGLLSTYKKAKNWNIPVVSILWIEACKTQRRICDPKDYPISNIDRYENPELYEKMKRHKSMQPNSECNKRGRVKAAANLSAVSKDLIAKTANDKVQKLTKSFSENSTSKNKQTDINNYFSARSKEAQKAPSEPAVRYTAVASNAFSIDSPATQLLNRIHSESYTPLVNDILKKKTAPDRLTTNNCVFEPNVGIVDAKRNLDFETDENAADSNAAAAATKTKPIISRRRSILTTPKIKSPPDTETPQRMTRRRSSLLATSTPNSTIKKPSINRQATFIKSNRNTINEESPSPETPRTKPTGAKSPLKVKASEKKIKLKPADNSHVKGKGKEPANPLAKGKASDTPRVKDKATPNNSAKVNESDTSKTNRKLVDTERKTTDIGVGTPKARVVQRHTIYTNKTIDMSAERKTPPKQTTAANRRTLYTPQAMEISSNGTVVEKSVQKNTNSFGTPVRSISETVTDLLTPKRQEGGTSLLEEHSKALTFSSTRPPNRRRTIFDVQMDIVSLRLQNINNATKKNALPEPEIENLNNNNDVVESKTFTNCCTSEKQNKDKAKETSATLKSPNADRVKSVKKRKLYVPDDNSLSLGTTAKENPKRRRTLAPSVPNERSASPTKVSNEMSTSIDNLNGKDAKTSSNVRAQDNQTGSTMVTSTSRGGAEEIKPTNARRTKKNSKSPEINDATLQDKGKETDLKKATESTKSTESNDVNAEKKSGTSNVQTNEGISCAEEHKVVDKKLSDEEKATNKKLKTRKEGGEETEKVVTENEVNETDQKNEKVDKVEKIVPVLVCTNMCKENVFMTVEAIETLGHFRLGNTVNGDTTHVVSSEPRRTLNLMRALLRGLWIVSFEWITASMKAGRWVEEEPYELRTLSRAVEICRAERQAFGDSYRCDLFRNMGSFYVSSRCDIISKENVQELIELCGGRVVDQRKIAKYIVGDWNRSSLDNKVFVSPFWILDSITHMQVLKYNRYTYRTNRKKLPTVE